VAREMEEARIAASSNTEHIAYSHPFKGVSIRESENLTGASVSSEDLRVLLDGDYIKGALRCGYSLEVKKRKMFGEDQTLALIDFELVNGDAVITKVIVPDNQSLTKSWTVKYYGKVLIFCEFRDKIIK
jgi:hypothetical protein